MRVLAFLSLTALVSCASIFSIKVADFSVPIANSLGQICWVKVDSSGAPQLRTATYGAQAAYDPGLIGVTDSVNVQFFGRSEAPASGCTSRDPAADEVLSAVLELKSDAQHIEVGGASYGAALGELANAGFFWLGATAEGNAGVGEELHFTNGRISVGF